jgi:Holliday junction resolvase
MENVFIIKKSGEKEMFSFDKLKKSLQRSGASIENIEHITKTIKPQIYDGMTSKEIYKKAYSLLKKINRTCASKYSLKKALFELGPTGYPFERLVSALLKDRGYKTEVSVVLQGECVTHEVDVLAEKAGKMYAVECKFHSKAHFVNNVKTPLYINSRFIDIQKKWNSNPENASKMSKGWIVSNTKFTLDAIKYAECVGLKLLSWDYPKNNGIGKNIDDFGLYPITALSTITKQEKELIIENGIVLIKELSKTPKILDKIGISPIRIKRVLNEVRNLV